MKGSAAGLPSNVHSRTHAVVSGRRDDAVAIRREGDAVDYAVMPGEGLGRGLAVERPQPDGAVIAARDDTAAIR